MLSGLTKLHLHNRIRHVHSESIAKLSAITVRGELSRHSAVLEYRDGTARQPPELKLLAQRLFAIYAFDE